MDHSVYNDALHQLHQSNLMLQEGTHNLVKEQARMNEMLTRIQVDLEVHKESQNDRMDEMMQNIDSDVKKVYNDLGKDYEKVHLKILEFKDEFVESKDHKELKEDLEGLKKLLTMKEKNIVNRTEKESILQLKIDDVSKDVKSFKKEIALKVKETIQESCMQKLEAYIGTEILEEIVSTINLKLNSVKIEFQGELEQTKIQLNDLNMVFVNLKHKIADLENPNRCFDESDLYTCSIDETRTPIAMKSMRMGDNSETPFAEISYSNETRSRIARNLDSTPKVLEGTVKPLDYYTLVQFTDNETKTGDNDESIQFVYNKKESRNADTITKIATDVADTKVWIGSLSKDLEMYQSKLASLEQIVTTKTAQPHQRSYNTDTEFSFQSVTTEGNQTVIRESWMSSFMINLAGVLDV